MRTISLKMSNIKETYRIIDQKGKYKNSKKEKASSARLK